MILGSTDPLTSRKRFISKDGENIAGLVVVFIILVSLFSMLVSSLSGGFLPMLVLDALALGIVYHLNALWSRRVIGLECNHCDKYIASNTPWMCPYCKKANMNANDHPFVGECEHCGNGPKSYKCHYPNCGGIIPLSADRDDSNFAYCLNSPVEAKAPEPTEREAKLEMHEVKKEDKAREIEIAELDERLLTIKNRVEGPKVKTPLEQKKEAFDKYFDGVMGARELARKKRAEVQELYKDDPEALKDANAAIDEFCEEARKPESISTISPSLAEPRRSAS